MEHSYRFAVREDVPLILAMIRELADYEGLLPEVVATEAVLGEWLFDRRGAEVLFALAPDGAEVGFALFFHNFSTFLGRGGVYLEDLYVRRSTGAAGTARASSGSWPASQRSGAAAGWSGGVSTPIPPASTSTSPSAPSRCATGPSTASPGRRWPAWRIESHSVPAAGGAA